MKLRRDSTFSPDLQLRADFPILANNPGLHYLDSAATSQKPSAVLDAIRDFYETSNANPHRGAYSLSVRATECYHGARVRIARFLGVKDSGLSHLHARHDRGVESRRWGVGTGQHHER